MQKGVARASCPCSMVSFFDMINMIDMIWRASVPTSRLPLCGRMVSGFHCGAPGGASVCLPADEQTLVPPQRRSRRHPVKKSLRLRVSALKNRRSVGTKCCSAFSPLHKPFIRLAERREGRALLVRAAFYAAITGKMPVPHLVTRLAEHWEGQASACPRTSRRSSLPVLRNEP